MNDHHRQTNVGSCVDSNTIENNNNDSVKNRSFICGVIEGFYGKPWNFDQRKDLFKSLSKLDLNAFMYAPKDDVKHRAKWRQLYSDVEANELKILIEEAKANGIDFYYSLAPGLDMVYSDPNELELLVRKYDQIVALGCESFAILFDDIEPGIINQKDREAFDNYAAAQVSVTNMIFEHLNRPKFLFCPTEYCESRAVPSVAQSNYLNTLGAGLHKDVDILWSGSRVISRLITEESIEMLTKVIRRPPVIWENLHANDYDKKRVFLGPYSGRSTKIIPKLRGVLTNPNCEYEANYIAIHTLAQWSRCSEDINPHNQCSLEAQQQRLPSTTSCNQETKVLNQPESDNDMRVYDPHRALVFAIRDWLPRLLENKTLPSGINLTTQLGQRSDDTASSELAKDSGDHLGHETMATAANAAVGNINVVVDDSNVDMRPETNSSASSLSTNKSEMDTSSSPALNNLADTNSCDSCDMQEASVADQTLIESKQQQLNDAQVEVSQQTETSACLDCVMCSAGSGQRSAYVGRPYEGCDPVTFENLSLLVDLFYLPFEHGSHGYTLLRDIKWLRDNSDVLISESPQAPAAAKSQINQKDNNDKDEIQMNYDCDLDMTNTSSRTIGTWIERAERLNSLCTCINRLVNNLIYDCPNKLLIIELYPYLADMRDVAAMIIDYIKFLRYRTSTLDHFYLSNRASKQKEFALSDEQEPWVHRGGLIGDVQRLLS